MKATAFLHKVNSTYYFRLRVPKEFLHLFPRKDIRRSLYTKSLTTAKRSLISLAFETERLFTQLRSRMFTESQIKKLVDDYIRYTLQKDDEYRTANPDTLRLSDPDEGLSEDIYVSRTHDWDVADQIINELEDNEGKSPLVETLTTEFLKDAKGITPEKDSYLFKVFCREIQQAHINTIRAINNRRDYGIFDDKYYLMNEEDARAPASPTPSVQPILENSYEGITFKELTELYLKEKEVTKKAEKTTRDTNRRYFNVFQELFTMELGIQNVPLPKITRALITTCLGHIERIPARRTNTKEFKNKSIKELLGMDLPKEKCFSVSKVKDHVSTLSSLFKWATQHDHMSRNPAEGLIPKIDKRQNSHKPYTLEELQLIIDKGNEVNRKKPAHMRWVPIIAMLSGMRHGEICQLWGKDIKEIDGVWCFHVHGEDGGTNRRLKKPKTSAGWRYIPIHSKLIELGFLDYVKVVGDGHLWAKMYYNTKGKDFSRHSDNFSKFNRKHITTDKKKVFHSMRSNFTNALKQAQVPLELVRELIGHTAEDTLNVHYAEDYNVAIKKEAIEKLKYEGVDFSLGIS